MTIAAPQTNVYRSHGARQWRTDRLAGVAEFHRTLPGYAPTPLKELPTLAAELGIAHLFVKEESARLGLPAFKILGASYAVSRALSARFGHPGEALPLSELRSIAATEAPVELIAATDGNHGRAVAHTARLLGLPARIFFPTDLTAAAKAAIAGEGAQTIKLALPYDNVVAAATAAALEAGRTAVLIQDTAWDGYEEIPQWIVDGYSTMFEEADDQLAAAGVERLDLVAVPVGVGSLAQAAVRHHRSGAGSPRLVTVEPVRAPAIITSLHEGKAVSVATASTVMAGLNCGTPSLTAWPLLVAGVDLAVAVDEPETIDAVGELERLQVDAGPCGAAALAAVRALAQAGDLTADSVVLLLSTEGRSANPLPGTAA